MKVPNIVQYLRFKNRKTLVAAVVCFQTLVIGLGVWGMMTVVRRELAMNMEQNAAAEHARAVEDLRKSLLAEFKEPFEFKSKEWDKAQIMIQEFRAPRGCVPLLLDQYNFVLCHPKIADQPHLRSLDFTYQMIVLDGSDQATHLGAIDSSRPRVGTTDLWAGASSTALVYCPQLRLTVMLNQPREFLAAAGQRITQGVMFWGVLAGVVILFLSVAGSISLVSRYDSMFEHMNHKLESEVERRTRNGLDIRNGLVFGLAKLAEERDNDTGRHLERIAKYCAILGEELEKTRPDLDHAWTQRLSLASSMHDIGKVGVPDHILLKQGPLTPAERAVMETHTVIGSETLRKIRDKVGGDELLTMSMQLTRHHHERWDGTGYPDKLACAEIPLAARVLAVADVYDAITSKRVYKPAMTHDQAAAIIAQSAGTHFDPALAACFASAAERFRTTCAELQPRDGSIEHAKISGALSHAGNEHPQACAAAMIELRPGGPALFAAGGRTPPQGSSTPGRC